MNNKGLTLVEVIATLVVLSIIAIIITPNIAESINDYKERTLESQLGAVKGATKNWVADNVDKVSCSTDNDSALMVSITRLQSDAYLDDNISNPFGGYLDDTDTFGLVSCKTIEDETNKYASNYKYTYGAYLDMDDYLKKMAIEYVKENSNSNIEVTTETLQSEHFIYDSIYKMDGSSISIPSKTISVKVTTSSEGNLKYEATIK